VLIPESNVLSVTNTATCMAEIVSKMSDPSLAMSTMRGYGRHIYITRRPTVTERVGLLVTLEAKPDKTNEVAAFLKQGADLVAQESATTRWYALRIGPATFGIFDTFADETGRQAHLSGAVANALASVGPELLASDPNIQAVDVLALSPTG
jgi:quinol monooxygenase YgiN